MKRLKGTPLEGFEQLVNEGIQEDHAILTNPGERLSEIEAGTLLTLMQQADVCMDTEFETEEECRAALRQMQNVIEMVTGVYPDVPIPVAILDIVRITEPKRPTHIFTANTSAKEGMLQEVRDFCHYDPQESWTGYIATARMILQYPALMNFFDQIIEEEEIKRRNDEVNTAVKVETVVEYLPPDKLQQIMSQCSLEEAFNLIIEAKTAVWRTVWETMRQNGGEAPMYRDTTYADA